MQLNHLAFIRCSCQHWAQPVAPVRRNFEYHSIFGAFPIFEMRWGNNMCPSKPDLRIWSKFVMSIKHIYITPFLFLYRWERYSLQIPLFVLRRPVSDRISQNHFIVQRRPRDWINTWRCTAFTTDPSAYKYNSIVPKTSLMSPLEATWSRLPIVSSLLRRFVLIFRPSYNLPMMK